MSSMSPAKPSFTSSRQAQELQQAGDLLTSPLLAPLSHSSAVWDSLLPSSVSDAVWHLRSHALTHGLSSFAVRAQAWPILLSLYESSSPARLSLSPPSPSSSS